MVTGHAEKRGRKGWTSVVLDYGYDAEGNRRRKRITRTMGVERNLVRYRKDDPVIGQPKTHHPKCGVRPGE